MSEEPACHFRDELVDGWDLSLAEWRWGTVIRCIGSILEIEESVRQAGKDTDAQAPTQVQTNMGMQVGKTKQKDRYLPQTTDALRPILG